MQELSQKVGDIYRLMEMYHLLHHCCWCFCIHLHTEKRNEWHHLFSSLPLVCYTAHFTLLAVTKHVAVIASGP